MADFVFNVAKGRVAELGNRVANADPATCALLVLALKTSGIESDAVLQDKTTLAALVAGTTKEATNSGYARKVLSTSAVTVTVDQVNDRVNVSIPNQTWSAVAAGQDWSKIVIAYRNATADPDSAIVPLVALDCTISPNGSDVPIQFNTSGFYRAS